MLKTLGALSCAAVAAAVFSFAPSTAKAGQDTFLGEMMLVPYNFCPRNYLEAAGQLLPISQNSALFSLMGTTYGGDGRTTFALPDLRGRVVMSLGTGPGLSTYREGQRGGQEQVTLNQTTMPAHNHAINSTAQLRASDGPLNAGTAADGALANQAAPHYSTRGTLDEIMEAGSVTVSSSALNTGGNLPHENRPPYLIMRWCIATAGIFPSRN